MKMKKSEMYRAAQFAVMNATYISDEDKLDIIHELAYMERVEKTCEDVQAEKEAKEKQTQESEVPY